MKCRLLPAVLALALATPAALAHHEPVSLSASLRDDGGGRLLVAVTLFGEVTGLPIREAVIAVELLAPSDFLVQLISDYGGILSITDTRPLPAAVLQRGRLRRAPAGVYRATLELPPDGRYILAFVDSTFRGENTITAQLVEFPLEEGSGALGGVLPETTTPVRWFYYAAAGLALPLLAAGVALVWRRRRPRTAGS
jgi:hypothetical protein